MSLAKSNFQTKTKKISLKPREKASTFGIANLSVTELLALILGSGTSKQSVYALSAKLSPIIETNRLSTIDLTQIQIGKNQLLKLQAVVELSSRLSNNQTPTILSPKDIYQSCSELQRYKQEYVIALYLDGRNKLIQKHTLAVGGHNFALLEPITLLHQAFVLPSAICVLVHNHPSGDPSPSPDDLTVTARLHTACELMGIQLLDHVIIGKNDFCSLRKLGVLPPN